MIIYYVQKEGVYFHGVFWTGFDRDEAIAAADRLAMITIGKRFSNTPGKI